MKAAGLIVGQSILCSLPPMWVGVWSGYSSFFPHSKTCMLRTTGDSKLSPVSRVIVRLWDCSHTCSQCRMTMTLWMMSDHLKWRQSNNVNRCLCCVVSQEIITCASLTASNNISKRRIHIQGIKIPRWANKNRAAENGNSTSTVPSILDLWIRKAAIWHSIKGLTASYCPSQPLSLHRHSC